jgi:hypothetical protein
MHYVLTSWVTKDGKDSLEIQAVPFLTCRKKDKNTSKCAFYDTFICNSIHFTAKSHYYMHFNTLL